MTISQFPPAAGGIPTGNTAGRPASPSIGDVYYNGQLAILEIYDGTNWVPCSAPAATPTITVADVGTSVAYGSAQGVVTITEGISGGPADSFLISASTGGYTATTTGTTVTITVGNNGSYTFSGQGVNNFGTSVAGPSTSATLTTVPQAPTIGTATTSGATTDVTVTWTLGQNGGKNLSSITITPYLNGTTAQTSQTAATTSSTTHTFTGLTIGNSYTFKVKTTNANGTSNESSATNSVTIALLITVDYLVIAGGGAGASKESSSVACGGGGAGGLRSTVTATGGGGTLETAVSFVSGVSHTITVGAGATGAAGTSAENGVLAASGNNSSISATGFSTITSTGGGGGAGGQYTQVNAASNGGSGGGGGAGDAPAQTAGSGTSGQGYAGGTGTASGTNANRTGGGGGGAGAVGVNGSGGNNGAGGNGVAVSITGSSVTYAGGGGAACGQSSGTQAAAGGSGGGGNASVSTGAHGGSGNANSGSGGGAFSGTVANNGGSGGSGVVILRATQQAASTTGSPTYTTSGSYHIYKFTGSGSITY